MPISKFIWQYYLIVPAAAVAAADAVAPALNNPDGILTTFRRFPLPTEGEAGEYLQPATHWASSFLACDTVAEGALSRESLEGYLNQSPALSTILWVRTKNPHHPSTPENERGIVVASNWPTFPPGAIADWASVTVALSNV